MQQDEEKASFRGPFVPQDKLKPVESTQFTSALKHRPPEEKDVFRSLLGREPIAGFTPQTFYVVAESDL